MPNFQANISMMFQEIDFLERFAAAAQAGFTAIEIMFPYDYEVEQISELLIKHKLSLNLFNLPPGDLQLGERGIAALPDRQDEFKQFADKALYYAQALNCTKLHCMSGIVTEDMDKTQCTNIYVENLKYLAQKAKPLGIEIMVEAINPTDIPDYLVNSQQQSLDIVQQTGMDNVKMQFDIYHCQMTEGNVASRFNEFLPHIGHVQIADVSGRHEPGTGEINYPFLFKHLDEAGYKAWVGCEYIPKHDSIKSLTWWRDILSQNITP